MIIYFYRIFIFIIYQLYISNKILHNYNYYHYYIPNLLIDQTLINGYYNIDFGVFKIYNYKFNIQNYVININDKLLSNNLSFVNYRFCFLIV